MAQAEPPKEILIQGLTRSGRVFRPSDWAERLCGVMAQFRPPGSEYIHGGHLGYSPYVRPTLVGETKAVIVDSRLKDLDARAYEFVLGFARDNELVTSEIVPPLPPAPATPPSA